MLQTQSPEFRLHLTLATADSIDSQILFIPSLAAHSDGNGRRALKIFFFFSYAERLLKPNAKLFNIKMMEVFIIHKAAADVKEPLFMVAKKLDMRLFLPRQSIILRRFSSYMRNALKLSVIDLWAALLEVVQSSFSNIYCICPLEHQQCVCNIQFILHEKRIHSTKLQTTWS